MKKILEFIKKIIIKFSNKDIKDNNKIDNNTVTNINSELINKLNSYDIIIVKMTEENIDIDHQVRPFIITEKDINNNEVKGYYLTSNLNNSFFSNISNKGLKLIISKERYNISKNSLISLQNLVSIPYENVKHNVDHLDSKDINRLKKYRNLINNIPVISNKDNKVVEIGDVVAIDNNNFIIYQQDNTNCYGYVIKLANEINMDMEYNYINFNNELYFVDYSKQRTFKNDNEIKIVKRFNNDLVDKIIENKKLKKFEQKQKTKVKRK